MDNEFDVEIIDDENQVDVNPCLWVPEDDDQALRWECLKLSAVILPSDACLKLASSMFYFVKEGKIGPKGIVKGN